MRKKITQEQLAARPKDPVNLSNGLGRFGGMVEHHVSDDSIYFTVVQGQVRQITKAKVDASDPRSINTLASLLEHRR